MRPAGRLLSALAAFLIAPGALGAQERFQQGLLELRVTGTNPVLVNTLVDSSGTTLVPLSELLRQTQIPYTQSATEWSLQWPPPDFATTLDPVTGRFTRAGTSDSIPERERYHQPPELFLALGAIERLLAVQAQYIPEELTAVFTTAGGFPVNRRADIERRLRARASLRGAGEGQAAPYRAVTGGLAINWSAASNFVAGQPTAASLRGSAGAALWGGELELSGDVFNTRAGSDARSIFRYSRPFPENRWLQQITLGAVTTRTPQPVFMQGVVISNEPYIPPEFFQATVLRPAVPTGWVAEVYEGSHLIGIAQDASQEGVEVPLSYGMNPVRVRLLGPAGQEVTEDVQYLIPHARVPVSTLRYSLGAGRCRLTCDDFAYGAVSTGLTIGLSAGAGLQYASTDSTSETKPYVSIGVNPRPDLSIDVHSVLGFSEQLDAQYVGLENASLQFALAHTRRRSLATAVPTGLRMTLNGALRVYGRTITILNQLVNTDGPGIERYIGSLGTPVGSGFVFLQHEFASRTPDIFSVRVTRNFANPLLRSAPISAETLLGSSGGGLDLATLQGSIQVPRFGSIQARMHWRRDTEPLFSLSIHSRRQHMTTSSYAALQDRRASASVSASGSLVVDPTRRVTAAPEAAVGLAGIAGRAFIDENGNGLRDEDETVVPEISIAADGRIATTDQHGRFALWGVRPVRATEFTVDTLAIPELDLMTLAPVRVLRPVPNTFVSADIPLVRSREVSGHVLGTGGTGIGGVSVELRSANGDLAQEVRTFTDGTFYFPRVPPGSYRVLIAPASLAALGVAAPAEPLSLVVAPGGGSAIQLAPIHLRQ